MIKFLKVMTMKNMEINDIKIRINELENEVLEIEEKKKQHNYKTENIRKFAVLNCILAGILHFIGPFIHPSLLFVALGLILFGVAPEGFIVFHREDIEAKFDKQINDSKEEIEKLKEILMKECDASQEYMSPLKNLIKDSRLNTSNVINQEGIRENKRRK